ncbi:MAG TPA: hypothetical protein VJZ27_13660 [Aggregatilineales bacterium]|nr:hypothetical protein [Aggregatilineales bacterium]
MNFDGESYFASTQWRQIRPMLIERTAEGGLPYWRAESQRFARTPCGERLREEIAAIEKLLKEQEK